VEGTLLEQRDCLRLVIGFEMLQRSVAVEVSPEMIVPLRDRAFQSRDSHGAVLHVTH
jgi:hypothetical protein